MQMKTKALLACSVTIFLFLGVVGIASAAPPDIVGSCNCGCVMSDFNPPFCWGMHPRDFARGSGNNARLAAECLVACLRDIPYFCV